MCRKKQGACVGVPGSALISRRGQVIESQDTCHLFMERCQGGELLGLMEHMEFSEDGTRSLQFDDYCGGEPVEFTEKEIVFILHQVLLPTFMD